MNPIFPQQSAHVKPLGQPFIDESDSLSQELVGWWPMSEGGGLTVYDRSQNNNDGAMTSITVNDWVAGNHGGKALELNGTSGYVDIGNASDLDFERTDAFSAAVWMKFDAFATSPNIVGKGLNSGNFRGWIFHYNSAVNAIRLYLSSSWSSNAFDVRGTTALSTNTWYHVAFTYDGSSSANGVNFYINGANDPRSVSLNNLTGTIKGSASANIGARGGAGLFMDGLVNDVRIWNRELHAHEIQSVREEPFPLNSRQSRIWLDSVAAGGAPFESAFSLGVDGNFTTLPGPIGEGGLPLSTNQTFISLPDSIGEGTLPFGVDKTFTDLPGSVGEGSLILDTDQTFADLPGPVVEGGVTLNADQAFTDLANAVGNAITSLSIIAIIDALPEATVDDNFTLTETLSETIAGGVSFESVFTLGESMTLSNGIQALPVAQITLSLTTGITDLAQATAETIAALSWIGNVTIFGSQLVATPSTRTFAIVVENRTFIVTE